MRKEVNGYEGRYEVSDEGEVFSLITNRTLRAWGDPEKWSSKHLRVALHDGEGQKTFLVHLLVAAAFLPPKPLDSMEIRHIDGDHLNNNVSNLEWTTRSRNVLDQVRDKVHNNARKTHCKNGHEFSPENTVERADGGRRCLTCKRASSAAYKKRAAER